MAAKRDYYELLGVARNASDKEIKAAYRRLARQHHPDVTPGDRAAEERFKGVAEAFAGRSDPEKRATYDRGGHEAFGPGFDPFAGMEFDFRDLGFGDLSELLGMFSGGRRRRPRSSRGGDTQSEIRIPFVEAVRGTTVSISLPRRSPCAACAGTGRGAARAPGAPCRACGGSGAVPAEERLNVRIPPGIEDGGRVRLPGRGDSGSSGGAAGDAYLIVRVDPHPTFRREGRDLHCEIRVGISRAALGGTVEVPTLDGPAEITLPAGTPSGRKLRLRGKGVPGRGGVPAGDLYAAVQIVPPRKLDARSRQILEELERLNPDRP